MATTSMHIRMGSESLAGLIAERLDHSHIDSNLHGARPVARRDDPIFALQISREGLGDTRRLDRYTWP